MKPSPFGLTEADFKPGSTPRKRLDARKRLKILPFDDPRTLHSALAHHAWALAEEGAASARIIVFCSSRKDAEDTRKAIQGIAKGDKKLEISPVAIETELFVGGRRVLERQKAADRLRELGFIAGTKTTPSRTSFLIATSAGEVGVDLDADHMVSDLAAWERMV